jgi:hypothetical protein
MPFPPPHLQERSLHQATEAMILIVTIRFQEVLMYSHLRRQPEAFLSLELQELVYILS